MAITIAGEDLLMGGSCGAGRQVASGMSCCSRSRLQAVWLCKFEVRGKAILQLCVGICTYYGV